MFIHLYVYEMAERVRDGVIMSVALAINMVLQEFGSCRSPSWWGPGYSWFASFAAVKEDRHFILARIASPL